MTKAQLKLKQITEQLTKLKDQQHAKAEIIRKAEQEAKKVNQLNLSIQKLKNTKVCIILKINSLIQNDRFPLFHSMYFSLPSKFI